MERHSQDAGKDQFLLPYFVAAHPGATDEDMRKSVIWPKANGFRADQVRAS